MLARTTTTVLAAMLAGCSSSIAHPIRTSLIDITGESRQIDVPSGWSFLGPIAQHRQATSVAGLLHIPDAGQEFQFSGGDDVTTAVGVAVLQSYRLIGEADCIDGADKVRAARAALEGAQEAASVVSSTTLDIASARRELAAAGEPDRAPWRARIDVLVARRDQEEGALAAAREALRAAANQTGIMIARWDARERGGTSIELAGGRIGVDAADARAGFVILAGLRVATVVFGEDFWWLLNNLRPHEKDYIDQIGIATHLLQARDVAYTSDLSVGVSAAIELQLRAGALDLEDRARLAAYWSFTGQYTNSGTLPRVTWKREPFCFACSLDLPELAEQCERTLPNSMQVAGDAYGPASFQGWRTVAATITYLRDVPLFFGWKAFSWKEHAAKYAESRTMRGAPACPRCSGTDRAVVPGRAEHVEADGSDR